LVAGEFATLHAQDLDPLDALAGAFAARLVVFLDAGLHAAPAADALADVQRVAHQHAGLGFGGVDVDLLAVGRGVAGLEPQARLGLFFRRHQAVVLLEVLGPFGGRLGVVGLRHQRRRAHQRRQLSMPPERRKPRRDGLATAAEGSAEAGGAVHPGGASGAAPAGGVTWVVTVVLQFGKCASA
jgi:hypothetical protein